MTVTSLTDYDIHLFHEGQFFESFQVFGAHLTEQNGKKGTSFSVWAPHAKQVSVVGNFNNWDRNNHKMKKMSEEGIWNLFIEGIEEGEIYKYEIITSSDETLLKADPYAFQSEVRPNTASVVADLTGFNWTDQK